MKVMTSAGFFFRMKLFEAWIKIFAIERNFKERKDLTKATRDVRQEDQLTHIFWMIRSDQTDSSDTDGPRSKEPEKGIPAVRSA